MSVRCKDGTQSPANWEARAVEGAYEGVGKKQAAKTNKQFKQACEREGVEPTARQYSKWARGMGRWK